MKRSTTVRVALLGAAAFAIAGCKEDDPIRTHAFDTVDACIADATQNGFSADQCKAQFMAAQEEHLRTAPHYADQALCEEQHGGSGSCQMAQTSNGGGSFFMPLMAGYLMGNMMGGSGNSMRSQPFYQTKDRNFTTPGGGAAFTSKSGAYNMNQSAFRSAPSTVKSAPMTRATISKSSGFGASGTSVRGGSFGG